MHLVHFKLNIPKYDLNEFYPYDIIYYIVKSGKGCHNLQHPFFGNNLLQFILSAYEITSIILYKLT